MRFFLALALVAVLGCKKKDEGPATVSWPKELTRDWKRVTIEEGGEHCSAVLEKGTWRLEAPRRGDADPDTIDRLKFILAQPQVLSARPVEMHKMAAHEIFTLETAGGETWRVGVHPIVLGAPVAVTIQDLGDFTVSATEFANKLPKPEELLSAGLWVAAERHARSLSVTGPVSYELTGAGEDWEVRDGGKAARDLDIPPGDDQRASGDRSPSGLTGISGPSATGGAGAAVHRARVPRVRFRQRQHRRRHALLRRRARLRSGRAARVGLESDRQRPVLTLS